MEKDIIEKIVRETVKEFLTIRPKEIPANMTKYNGVFETMEDAINASKEAYRHFKCFTVKKRCEIIEKIRELTRNEADIMGELGVSDTKMGNPLHKKAKHLLVADKTPGTEDIISTAWSGDRGLTLVEMAPYGIIGAITPSTNPSETVLCNSIGMLASGNVVVFNPHPGAVQISSYAVDLINRASIICNGPENLAVCVNRPSLQTADIMIKHSEIKLLVATGGPGVIKAMLSSGKKAIAAGAGNPPVLIDNTADIKKAAKDIIDGAAFDNNLPCIAEKEVVVLKSVADELIFYMQQNGAFLIDDEACQKLLELVLVKVENKNLSLNKKWVGKDAPLYLKEIGINAPDNTRLIIMRANKEHPFVQEELMMPILPIVEADDIEQAISFCVQMEHGNRHSAHMHSKNIDNLTNFARAVNTTIFVKNAPSYAGIGYGAEGYTTFTIAGPTGEGLTSAKDFTRSRRCVMSDAFNIL